MSDLTVLAADLDAAARIAAKDLRAVVARGAHNIRDDWRARVSDLAHAPDLPAAITYDVTTDKGLFEAEIGPDKDRKQGALGNLREFGSVNNQPHNDGGQALDAEEPRFVAALEELIGRSLG